MGKTMKYSLRSLMIVVTLVCLTLGSLMGRIEYLRRRALFHEREAEIIAERIETKGGFRRGDISKIFSDLALGDEEHTLAYVLNIGLDLSGQKMWIDDKTMGLYLKHRRLAEEYRRIRFRPWIIVDESRSDP